MTNEEKAREIAIEYEDLCVIDLEDVALQAMEWKDEQLIEQLTAFAQHLQKRGAFRDDLCMDFEHEAQSFIEMQNNKEL